MDLTKKNVSYFAPGVVIAYGNLIDTKPHKHPLWQVCLPIESSFLNSKPLTSGLVIKPNEMHQLKMLNGWILLAEPESMLGEAISEIPLQLQLIKPAVELNELLDQLSFYPKLKSALVKNSYVTQDNRLLKLLARLDSCFKGGCLKPEQWRAREVADWLTISESRFLHLIKSELGIAWRPYLLWRRLICAVQAIRGGLTLTEAAYVAGFSDASHLSRTVKKNFGMTSKQLVLSFQSR